MPDLSFKEKARVSAPHAVRRAVDLHDHPAAPHVFPKIPFGGHEMPDPPGNLAGIVRHVPSILDKGAPVFLNEGRGFSGCHCEFA